MLNLKFLKFKISFYALAFVSFVFLLMMIYVKHLREKVHSLETTLRETQTNLEVCQRSYDELLQTVKLQEQEYRKKVSQLLQKAQRPVRHIEIPKAIEKPVVIENEDCQKMTQMIDEFLKIEREERK